MDVPCPRCTEPWDTEVFFTTGDARDLYRKFRTYGCAALFQAMEGCTDALLVPQCEQTAEGKSIQALMDIAGDDVGDVASDIEDFQAAGLLT